MKSCKPADAVAAGIYQRHQWAQEKRDAIELWSWFLDEIQRKARLEGHDTLKSVDIAYAIKRCDHIHGRDRRLNMRGYECRF
jgi:hypothetical protein